MIPGGSTIEGTQDEHFLMHIKTFTFSKTEQLSAADKWSFSSLVNAHNADAEINFQMICINNIKRLPNRNAHLQCSLDKFTFRAWLYRNLEIFYRRGQWCTHFFFLNIKTRSSPHPTALLGSQHSAWCISQVQIKSKLQSQKGSSSVHKTRCQEEMFQF